MCADEPAYVGGHTVGRQGVPTRDDQSVNTLVERGSRRGIEGETRRAPNRLLRSAGVDSDRVRIPHTAGDVEDFQRSGDVQGTDPVVHQYRDMPWSAAIMVAHETRVTDRRERCPAMSGFSPDVSESAAPDLRCPILRMRCPPTEAAEKPELPRGNITGSTLFTDRARYGSPTLGSGHRQRGGTLWIRGLR